MHVSDIWHISMFGPFEFIMAGVLVGFCVGITGVGGGSLMTPILISLFRIEPHIAIGTDLLYAAISKFCGSLVHAKKMNIVWPIVIWLAAGSIPASFATHWVLDNYLSQSANYKMVLTMVLGFMLTLTGVSIMFRAQIEALFNKIRSKDVLEDYSLDYEKESLQTKSKRAYIILMGIILGVFVTLSSVGAGAFGIMALVLMFPNLPMIRIIQSNNLMLVDKFYAIKNITLPAWKNQISLAISLQEQKNSVQLANTIDDATNELLKRNADLLHQNSVDTARANQRSVIDIETLEHVQNTLINTVNDVLQIQKEGVQKRAEAAQRLRALQDNLNHLVLESSSSGPKPN